MCLNHPETIPHSFRSMGKLPSMKPVPGTKMLGTISATYKTLLALLLWHPDGKRQETYACLKWLSSDQSLSPVQSLSHVRLFATPWTAAHQASLSITNSQSPPKPMSTESVMPSNHLILCCPLLLLPSLFPSIRVFSNESALHIRRPKYWSFSFNISPSKEHPGLISFRMDLRPTSECILATFPVRISLFSHFPFLIVPFPKEPCWYAFLFSVTLNTFLLKRWWLAHVQCLDLWFLLGGLVLNQEGDPNFSPNH